MPRSALAALALVVVPACQAAPDLPEFWDLEARVELDEGLEMARVRAGVFATDAVTVLQANADRSTYAPDPFTVFATHDGSVAFPRPLDSRAVVEYVPLREVDVSPSGVLRLQPPLPLPDDKQRLVVWYDEDVDGVFELSATDDSECGRNVRRAFEEHGGAELTLDPLLDHGHPFMLGKASGILDDGYVEVELQAEHAERWTVRLGSGNCQPPLR